MGGIYALERIAAVSDAEHPQVMELLSAFVREHAPQSRQPWQHDVPARARSRTPEHEADALRALTRALELLADRRAELDSEGSGAGTPAPPPVAEESAPKHETRPDVWAALRVIGRAERHKDRAGAELNFKNVDLREIDLSGTNFQGANFARSNLTAADLRNADLRQADLGAANLTMARLDGAQLQSARLIEADLTRADLQRAHLEGARLGMARLHGAYLHNAHLEGAQLDGSDVAREFGEVDFEERPYLRGDPEARGPHFREILGRDAMEKAGLYYAGVLYNSGARGTTVWPVDFNPEAHGAHPNIGTDEES